MHMNHQLNSILFQLEVLEMLAQCGADLNVRNKDDETPSGKFSAQSS